MQKDPSLDNFMNTKNSFIGTDSFDIHPYTFNKKDSRHTTSGYKIPHFTIFSPFYYDFLRFYRKIITVLKLISLIKDLNKTMGNE
ncbi:hypothetical protein DID76_00750 [Candidatus Marinamargulisbacteria bacterium SCGC AG-414-C22]|nr:hypothetical protein DID76_00750 [Candidatus Marinamargulisbacteria bacterium SCGC AG-414-C22]